MAILTFDEQFAESIVSGAKAQTIRTPRRDGQDPVAGDRLYLFAGPSMSSARKLGEARCTLAMRIRLAHRGDTAAGAVVTVEGLNVPVDASELARRDGFSSAESLFEWFDRRYGLPFDGVLIRWDGFES